MGAVCRQNMQLNLINVFFQRIFIILLIGEVVGIALEDIDVVVPENAL